MPLVRPKVDATNMSEVERRWKRKLPYRIYDYNYKVGESYYNPQTEYIESRDAMRKHKTTPPECASFAERFAAKPFYGKAYGLPYDDHHSLLDEPFPRRRSASASRGDARDFEPAYNPTGSRIGRGRERDRAPRDRRRSLNFDESDFDRPRRKFSLMDDLDFKTPISRYVDSDFGFRSSLDRDPLVSDDQIGISPAMKEDIQRDIKKLERKFRSADKVERGTGGPRAQQWREVVYNDPDMPKKKTSVKHDHVSYRDPDTGASVRKTSYQETSRLESSKPPRAPPRPSRLLSIEDSDFKLPPRPRRRHLSLTMGDDDDFDFTPRSLRSGGDNDIERKFSSARKMFEARRAKESDELGDKIDRMMNKMRKHSLTGDEKPGISFTRTIRASSLDPEPRVRSTMRTEKYATYGYSK